MLDVDVVLPDGLVLRTSTGKQGFVSWEGLTDRLTRRVKLGYGYALTIDTAKGMTSDHHILALPRGSAGASARKPMSGRPACVKSLIVTSKGAELEQISARRRLASRQR